MKSQCHALVLVTVTHFVFMNSFGMSSKDNIEKKKKTFHVLTQHFIFAITIARHGKEHTIHRPVSWVGEPKTTCQEEQGTVKVALKGIRTHKEKGNTILKSELCC